MLGICYSLYSDALIPAISIIVPKDRIGTAFGVLLMLESVVLSFLPYFSGMLIEKS